jgi:UrcA family protein
MRLRPLLAAAAAAATLAATPAYADSVRVEYKDLDLATAQGQGALQKRIEAAARQVCGMRDIRTGTRVPDANARDCYKTVLADMEQKFAGIVDKANKGG